MKIVGFIKVRNEIIREQNLYRVLSQIEQLCDYTIICDDASNDGTREHIEHWLAKRPGSGCVGVYSDPSHQNFQNEMHVKQMMLQHLHKHAMQWSCEPTAVSAPPDWVFWLDGDELLDDAGIRAFRPWLEEFGHEADVWSFHYTQLWRSASWARIDEGFDEGYFWKLWRYRPDLSFDTRDGLHHAQMPIQYLESAVAAAYKGGTLGRARRAPFEIIHVGNYGKNLTWKAIQYRNSGKLEAASLARHLYFTTPRYRRVDTTKFAPEAHDLITSEDQPVPFTDQELRIIESMGSLRKQPGLFVVIIPTHNRGYMLDRTLASVLAQTETHWVCIVLDDGSTDNTPEVMQRWQEKDPRFFYCRYPENQGGVAMNEIGMNLAIEMGEYWVRLGSDDYFLPHKLELDGQAFALRPAAGVVFGPYRDEHETFIGTDLRNPPSDATAYLKAGGFAVGWANIAVRCSALEAVRTKYGAFCDPSIRNMEDYVVNVRLAHVTQFAWRARAVARDGARMLFVGNTELPTGVHPNEIEYDAIWRIGADGASQMSEQCKKDAVATEAVLTADRQRA